MTKEQKEYIKSNGFIIFDGFGLSIFMNIIYKREFLYTAPEDENELQKAMADKSNMTETGLKYYYDDLKIMYNKFEETYLQQISI